MDKEYLDEYFRYICTVYLKDYSKYLSEEKINKIKNMQDIFKIDNSSKYKIYLTDKINICTNIDDFIMENNITNDSNLKDISIDGKIYVKYIIDNKDNPIKFIINTILEPMIKFLVGKYDNVIRIGAIDIIVDDLVKKYNLKNIRPYASKEKVVALKIKELVGNDIFYDYIFNDNLEIKNKFNELSEYYFDFDSMIKELNKEYFDGYYKKIGKVYYSDTLYDYENIDYNKVINELDKINELNNNNINNKIKRIHSAKEGINELYKNLLIFNSNEQFLIKNSEFEINNILSKINDSNYEIYFSKFEKIEELLFPLTQKIWKKELSLPIDSNNSTNFKYLIGDFKEKKYVETRLISNYQLSNIPCKLKEYGFIFGINNIIYSSTKNFLYSINEDKIEIDDISDSKLITPNMIIKDNLKNNDLTGKILLENPIPCGIYVTTDIDSKLYDKALELSDKYELPLVKIKTILPKVNNDINEFKSQIEHKEEIKPKISFKEKMKNFGHKFIYEEEMEEFKKNHN